jgi:hypothetical protein
LTDEQRERRLAQKRIRNAKRTPEQRRAERARMTDEQRERRRAQSRVYDAKRTPEQRREERRRAAARAGKAYRTLEEWRAEQKSPVRRLRASARMRAAMEKRPRVIRITHFVPRALSVRYRAEYDAFKDMHKRCLNPNHKKHRIYGARGISICDRWHRDKNPRGVAFWNFLMDMGVRADPMLSLDRIDPRGGYSPSMRNEF